MINRVFICVLDSFGLGALPDAATYGDEGSNTLKACYSSSCFSAENLISLGLFNIDGVDFAPSIINAVGCFGRMAEQSAGKDTTIGHWEIAGLISKKPMQTFPDGFPEAFLEEFKLRTGRSVLCNKPYSGTQVIFDYGERHIKTGELIVYTSADSVFQIAAHEEIVPVETLYRYCEIARNLLDEQGYTVGRVIARPFIGEFPNFTRTANRHDFSILPPKDTVLNALKDSGFDVIAVGKISDIFAGSGITESFKTKSNNDGMDIAISLLKKDFKGLCFINLVEFDSVYGHRNDIDGYAKAISEFDVKLKYFIDGMRFNDLLIITADHGCDPSTPSTDHSREYVPLLVYGKNIKQGVNLKTKSSFACVAQSVSDIFDLKQNFYRESFFEEIL